MGLHAARVCVCVCVCVFLYNWISARPGWPRSHGAAEVVWAQEDAPRDLQGETLPPAAAPASAGPARAAVPASFHGHGFHGAHPCGTHSFLTKWRVGDI